MKKTLQYIFLIFILLVFSNISIAQKQHFEKFKIDNKNLDIYQTDKSIYNFWWHKNKWFPKGDTLAYFVDENNYKGVINYGINFSSKGKRNISFVENFKIYYMNVVVDNYNFHSKDSIIELEGFVTGGWSDDNDWKGVNEDVEIFFGERRDTISKLYFEYLYDPKEVEITYNSKLVIENVVLDSFPSFYIKNEKRFRTKGFERKFKIKAKINQKTILVFGLKSSYAEIFEIGKLVFDTKQERKARIKAYKKQKGEPIDEDFQVIIHNNVQELFKDTITKPQLDWYYETIDLAENHMMMKRFGKAKEKYNELLEKKHYIFARDLHNALRVSILSRDYITAIVFAQGLALKGVPITYFDANIFKRLKSSRYWNEFLANYSTLYETYESGLNYELIEQLEKLVVLDQEDYIRHAKGEFDRSKLKETTENIDEQLITLIKKQGFPTEEKIGINMYQDTLISTANDYYVLLNHSHQVHSKSLPEIKDIINKSAQNFEYDNVRDNLNILLNLNPCFMLYKGNLYNNKTCKLNQKELKKIEFSFNNPYGFILNQGELGILGYNKKNEAADDKFFEERYDFIKKLTDEWYEDEF